VEAFWCRTSSGGRKVSRTFFCAGSGGLRIFASLCLTGTGKSVLFAGDILSGATEGPQRLTSEEESRSYGTVKREFIWSHFLKGFSDANGKGFGDFGRVWLLCAVKRLCIGAGI
jgi:hypothetical protein